jgi:hypothetical protein
MSQGSASGSEDADGHEASDSPTAESGASSPTSAQRPERDGDEPGEGRRRDSIRERLRATIESEETDPSAFVRRFVARRGQVEGRAIAIPFLLMTAIACAMSCVSLWAERPLFSVYTLGLYGCVWFMGNGYREAWVHQNYVRQLLALIVMVLLLIGLALLHADDASQRIIYEQGTRVVREQRWSFYVASALTGLSGVILVFHGLGLGFGSRIYDKETGERVSHNVAREVYDIARARLAEVTEDDEEASSDKESG